MSLVFDSVDYLYPGARQVHGISMQVDTGELLAVIGPSGSGKSTLLKLVAGLETGHAGSILLNGRIWRARRCTGAASAWCSRAMPCFRICRWRTTWPTAWRCARSMPRSASAAPASCWSWSAWPSMPHAPSPSCPGPAAACRAGARGPSIPAPCCWTSRSRPWTPMCAPICATRFAPCSGVSAPPRCWSPTTRKRRWPWPTGWRCSGRSSAADRRAARVV